MISKSFLSGIFSIVSFILISNLAIPSTFAQCPPDVSGRWVYKSVETQKCCLDPSDNYENRRFKGSIPVVSQVEDKISASWVDEDDGESQVLTGVVNGNSVSGKIESTDVPPGCETIAFFVGIIKGNRIVLYFSNHETCETCRSHGKVRIKIIK